MSRFYSPQSDFSSDEIIITDKDELHHLHHVLRLKKGNKIEIFDGKGKVVLGEIIEISEKSVTIAVELMQKIKHKIPRIILACAVPKKTKFEMIIEKATELGVDEIIPMKTQRTEINISGDRLDKKMKRYRMVAINASKQSKRAIIPVIHPIMDLKNALNYLKDSIKIIPSLLGERKNLIDEFKDITNPKSISFFIGPEGDFTPKEYLLAQELGCQAVTLGPTILKVETAAICVLSCANLFYPSKLGYIK